MNCFDFLFLNNSICFVSRSKLSRKCCTLLLWIPTQRLDSYYFWFCHFESRVAHHSSCDCLLRWLLGHIQDMYLYIFHSYHYFSHYTHNFRYLFHCYGSWSSKHWWIWSFLCCSCCNQWK